MNEESRWVIQAMKQLQFRLSAIRPFKDLKQHLKQIAVEKQTNIAEQTQAHHGHSSIWFFKFSKRLYLSDLVPLNNDNPLHVHRNHIVMHQCTLELHAEQPIHHLCWCNVILKLKCSVHQDGLGMVTKNIRQVFSKLLSSNIQLVPFKKCPRSF